MKLTNNDYKKILSYYDIPFPKKNHLLKNKAESVLANKLCRCIKKVSPSNEAKGIGICTRSIFQKKGLTRGSFKCIKSKKNVQVYKRKQSTKSKTKKKKKPKQLTASRKQKKTNTRKVNN